MNALPDNLTDDELALLRLAGELPVGVGRAAANAESADGSAVLRDAFAALDGPLTLEAARTVLPAPQASVRAVLTAMRDAAAVPPAEAARRQRFRVRGWALYPAAAAAVLAFGMYAWWAKVHDQFAQAPPKPYIDPGPPFLLLRGEPDAELKSQTDDQIERQFEPLVIRERGGTDIERQLNALRFLEETFQ